MTDDRRRRLEATTRLVGLHEDDGAFDRELWRGIPPAERMAMVWDMVLEDMAWQGLLDGGEPRLQRSVCRIERR
jgi:hypothetical protein